MGTSWTNAQLDAISHSNSDLIISAAAGSGKTATLTERIIRKIKNGSDISRMLIVTFTKASASDLKSKISKALGEALKEDNGNLHIQKQLIKVGSADICTIDSFCMRLVKPNFDKLMLDADFRIGEQSEIDILEKETMAELIDELYESESKDESFLLVADCYSNIWSEDGLVSALLELRKKLLSTRDSIKTLIKPSNYDGEFFESDFGLVLKKHIEEALAYFMPVYKDAIEDFKDDSKGGGYLELFFKEYEYMTRLQNALDKGLGYDRIKEIVNDIQFVTMLRTALENANIPLAFYKSVRSDFKDFTKDLCERFFASSEAGIKSTLLQNGVICKAIYDILNRFEEDLLKKKRLYSVYSFNDISSFALKLLYDEKDEITAFAKEISEKYDEIYIDEYQDTNSVQDKIFKALSKDNRFMVGDIKQSIYRFRSAEPEIFSYYRTNFDKKKDFSKKSQGLSIFMSNNFRCDKHVIGFSNLVSNYMFGNSCGIPYESSDELIYSKKQPDDYKHEKTEVCLINSKGFDKHAKDVYQAEYVARRIKKMLDEDYLPNGEKVKPSHIAILLKSFETPSKLYIDALKKYGVTSFYESGDEFFEKPHIMLIMCILNAIDNPSRDIYLAGAMRSEVFGFSLEELVKIKRKAEKSASLYSTILSYSGSEALRKRLDSFLDKLREYKFSLRKMASHEAISYIFGKCGILSMCKSEEREDLIKLYNLAREYEGSSFKGLYSFLRYVEKISINNDEKSFKGDVTKENVKIMSIHASKGLEFEICFICNCENVFNYLDTGKPILFQRELGIAGYASKTDGLAKFDTMARKCIALQINREMHEEEMRVLYVAMTRAKSKLVLTGTMSDVQKKRSLIYDGRKYVGPYVIYNSSSYLKYILGAIANEDQCFFVTNVDADTTPVDSEIVDEAPLSRERVDSYKEIINSRLGFKYKYDYLEKLPSKMSISRLYPEILDRTENDDIVIAPLNEMPSFLLNEERRTTGAERGTATHVFLQFCDFNSLISNGVSAEVERLINASFISRETAEMINLDHLELFLGSQLLKDILGAKRVIREFRFNVMLNAGELSSDERIQSERVLVQGVTDCIYENEQGEIILVDYKTDKVNSDNYETVLKERHTQQLTYYKKACEMMFEMPVSRVLIYSVPLAKTIEI